jgi:5'-3' exonuclease
MGIPSLFRTIVEKYNEVHYWDANLKVDQLYLDYNCLIHHCKAKLKVTPNMTLRELEEEMIAEVIKYTSYIITDVIKPQKLVYIAMDGPVPMGKLVRQRARRYKKVQDDIYKKKTKAKYNIDDVLEFDGNKITPGTPFMAKLASRIKNFAMIGSFSKHIVNKNKHFKIFVSDTQIVGEGEQKIFDFMKNGTKKPNGEYPTSVIYGLDADLIVLSMLQDKNIRLLREPQNSSVELASYHDSPFLYLDIKLCQDKLFKEYKLDMYDSNRVIKDFVFISFFGGNDFVEPFLHTKMRMRGLDFLLVTYEKVIKEYGQHMINEEDNVNFEVLTEFIKKISEMEEFMTKKQQLKKFSGVSKKLGQNAKSIEKYENDMSIYEHSFYKEKENPFHLYYENVLGSIDYTEKYEIWKQQYNTYYFKNANYEEIMEEYVRCLKWTWEYYIKGKPPSWLWVYKYKNVPLSSDFYKYLVSNDEETLNNMWKQEFEEDYPMTPIEQLLAVLPPQNAGLLPFSFHSVMRDTELGLEKSFPRKFKLDVVKGEKNIYSEPDLPPINVRLIKKMASAIPVSEPEQSRNILRDSLFCFKV